MTRLVSPEGVTVSVDDKYGESLESLGWKPPDAEKKSSANKSASSKPKK